MNETSRPPFTRMELAVAVGVALVAILVFQAWINRPDYRMLRQKRTASMRTITMGILNYAKDHEGRLPSGSFRNSTEAFQELVNTEEDSLSDMEFYLWGNRAKPIPANRDGLLEQHENCVTYVTGQHDEMPLDSPLVADEMENPGVYGSSHLYLRDRLAVVGYVGGHAKAEKLSKGSPGATVLGPPESGITDIFQPRPTGLLSVPRENILLP